MSFSFYMICFIFYFLIEIALIALIIISRCKIFKKANEKWWKVLIPFYNQYIELKIAKKNKLFCLLYLILYIIIACSLIIMLIALLCWGNNTSLSDIIGSFWTDIIGQVLMVFIWTEPYILLVLLVMNIFKYIGLVHLFNLRGAFAVGLTLLPFVFYPILAFGNSQYIGNKYNYYDPSETSHH